MNFEHKKNVPTSLDGRSTYQGTRVGLILGLENALLEPNRLGFLLVLQKLNLFVFF